MGLSDRTAPLLILNRAPTPFSRQDGIPMLRNHYWFLPSETDCALIAPQRMQDANAQ